MQRNTNLLWLALSFCFQNVIHIRWHGSSSQNPEEVGLVSGGTPRVPWEKPRRREGEHFVCWGHSLRKNMAELGFIIQPRISPALSSCRHPPSALPVIYCSLICQVVDSQLLQRLASDFCRPWILAMGQNHPLKLAKAPSKEFSPGWGSANHETSSWGVVPAPLWSSHRMSGKFLNLSEPHFLHLQNGG